MNLFVYLVHSYMQLNFVLLSRKQNKISLFLIKMTIFTKKGKVTMYKFRRSHLMKVKDQSIAYSTTVNYQVKTRNFLLVLIWIHFLLLHTKVVLVREKAITSGSAILATNTWFHISQNSKMLLEVLHFFSILLHENDVDSLVRDLKCLSLPLSFSFP